MKEIKFFTKVEIQDAGFEISHKDRIFTMGSCFSENISSMLKDAGFNVMCNPFGVLFNPESIFTDVGYLLEDRKFTGTDLIDYKGVYYSFSHHGRFSGTDCRVVLDRMNKSRELASEFLKTCSVIIFTFGTSYVYLLKKNGMIVSNCHKIPQSEFFRRRLNVSEITETWKVLLEKIRKMSPSVRILFTVSPVRHLRDGAFANQLSKSVLLLAVEKLVNDCNCSYFPSYEIFMDELRDYRFYADDLVHPSSFALKYLWKKFSETFFSERTVSLVEEWESIKKSLEHRPFNTETKEYSDFKNSIGDKLKSFLERNPDFKNNKSYD